MVAAVMKSQAAPSYLSFPQIFVLGLLALLALSGLLDLADPLALRSVNLHHLWAAMGLLVVLLHGRFYMPPLIITQFFVAAILISIFAYVTFGFHPAFINLLYCFYLLLLGMVCTRMLAANDLRRAMEWAGSVILAAITLKNFFYMGEIAAAIGQLQDRVFVPTVVAGGTNMEATFALFAALFLRRSRFYWLVCTYAFVLAIIYSSRVAMVGAAIVFLYDVFSVQGASRDLLWRQVRMALLVLAALVGLGWILSSPVVQFAIERFQNIGYEPGSIGRLVMWQTAPELILSHPMGVGAGHATDQLSLLIGMPVLEDNVHNIFLQVLLDLGILGLVSYVIMIVAVARRALPNLDHPLWLAIALYGLMGMLQFRAYDPFIFFWLGLMWDAQRSEKAP